LYLDPRLHADFRPAAEATLAALLEAYPRVALEALRLYDPEPGDFSLGCCDSGRTIALNAHWFDVPRALFDDAVVRGRSLTPAGAPPWHGHVGDLDREFDRLLAHEFWHAMADGLPGAAEFCRRGHAAAVAEPSLAVSGYAILDAAEWGAETFAAIWLGGAGSPQVAEMVEFLAASR
jgi:hypothetical protein